MGQSQFQYKTKTYDIMINPFIKRITQELFLVKTLEFNRAELEKYDTEGIEMLIYLGRAVNEIKIDEQKKHAAKVKHASKKRRI